jgi:hypothetical protein
MTNEFKNINAKFNDDTYPEYPYISGKRITLLKKGLYRKHNADYRGVTAVYDKEEKTYRYPLYGMYYIPEDIIIVPEGLDLSEGKLSLLNAAVESGYVKVNRPPKFNTIEFSSDSPEARAALANKATFYYSKFNKSNKSNITI